MEASQSYEKLCSPEGLSMCQFDSNNSEVQYFATCRDYEQAYRNGSTGKEITYM